MKNQILDRDSFVNEIYSKRTGDELNEGLFDFFKTLLKQEWSGVKSKNSEIKKKLEEADRLLSGFTLMKMKKSGQCAEIRQALCDFANTLYDSKAKELEDGKKLQKMLMGLKDKDKISAEDKETVKVAGDVGDYMKKFNIKDKALADKLTTYAKKITTLCKGDPDIRRWSDILRDDARNIINDLIIAEYEKIAEDEDKERVKKYKEKLDKQIKEKQAEVDKKNKEAQKKQDDAIKALEKERGDMLSKMGVTPIKNQTGDKAFNTLNSAYEDLWNEFGDKLGGGDDKNESHKYSFRNILNESEETEGGEDGDNKGADGPIPDEVKDIMGGDIHFGFNELKDNEKFTESTKNLLLTLKEFEVVHDAIDKSTQSGKTLKDTPSDAVHALFVGLIKLISNAVMGEAQLDDDAEMLLARCAIDSDKTLGYGLPLIDENKPDAGNIFVAISQQLSQAKDDEGIFDKKMLNTFKQSMSKMFDQIRKKAEELKEEREKENEKEAKKVEEEDKKDE